MSNKSYALWEGAKQWCRVHPNEKIVIATPEGIFTITYTPTLPDARQFTVVELDESAYQCDCASSGNAAKPKQHGADPHAKNCNFYLGRAR